MIPGGDIFPGIGIGRDLGKRAVGGGRRLTGGSRRNGIQVKDYMSLTGGIGLAYLIHNIKIRNNDIYRHISGRNGYIIQRRNDKSLRYRSGSRWSR